MLACRAPGNHPHHSQAPLRLTPLLGHALPGCAQVGWLSGPHDLLAAVTKAHQFLIFTVPSALQVGSHCGRPSAGCPLH